MTYLPKPRMLSKFPEPYIHPVKTVFPLNILKAFSQILREISVPTGNENFRNVQVIKQDKSGIKFLC